MGGSSLYTRLTLYQCEHYHPHSQTEYPFHGRVLSFRPRPRARSTREMLRRLRASRAVHESGNLDKWAVLSKEESGRDAESGTLLVDRLSDCPSMFKARPFVRRNMCALRETTETSFGHARPIMAITSGSACQPSSPSGRIAAIRGRVLLRCRGELEGHAKHSLA